MESILDRLTTLDFSVFDTETTGLDSTAEIVSISFVDYYGVPFFSELVKPVGKISEGAMRIHGITEEMVADCRSIRFYWDYICTQYINKKVLVGYNVIYDLRLLMQSVAAQDVLLTNTRSFSPLMVIDVMQLAQMQLKLPKFLKLQELAIVLGVDIHPEGEQYHGSLFDAQITAACLRELVQL